jgi:hypothetical protein
MPDKAKNKHLIFDQPWAIYRHHTFVKTELIWSSKETYQTPTSLIDTCITSSYMLYTTKTIRICLIITSFK